MLEFYGRKFTCDECPICEGIEHRVRVAREGGYEPQLEYCGCDKVQTEFFISGYCSDAFEADKPQGKLCEPRKTGRAYRRKMRKQKKEKLMRIMTYGYKSGIGYTDWGWKTAFISRSEVTSSTPRTQTGRRFGRHIPIEKSDAIRATFVKEIRTGDISIMRGRLTNGE